MRFEVPQFIEIEDKIFGPFTWRQFISLVGGVGFAVALFFVAHIFIFLTLGLFVGGMGVLLAFYQVNNRPFSKYLESIFSYTMKSKLYLWKKTGTGIYNQESKSVEEPAIQMSSVPSTSKSNLTSLSRKLELEAIQKEN